MDPTPSFHRRSPSTSDRLLGAFTFSPSPTASTASAADELNEAELLWAADFSDSENQLPAPLPADRNRHRSFNRALDSGILVALTELDCRDGGDSSVFRGKSSVSSSRTIPSLPRPPAAPGSEYQVQSAPSRKLQQSAPVKVPILLSRNAPRRRNFDELALVDDGDDDDDNDEMLPPHEIVARGSGVSPRTTFSVLEGVGRTLKGRDLCQVRNAVLRQTGFLD